MANKPLKTDTNMSSIAGSDNDDNAIEDDNDCTNCIWTRLETVSYNSTLFLKTFCTT
jgi:hypothetical protein